MSFHLEFQVILQVNGSRSFPTEKWPHGIYIDWLYFPDYLPTNCGVCEPGGYPTDAFLLWKSLGISLGITSDFTSEWIAVFVTEKWPHGTFIDRIYLPDNLPTNCDVCGPGGYPTDAFLHWNFTWNFTWNYKWFYKWMDHAVLQKKNDLTVLLSTGYTCQTTCRQTVMCAGPADTLRTHFYIGISLGISLGITSDFTSEWITIFCNRKMITRYSYQPIMLARQPTSELWCVRALCITYGLISALQITWNFTWNFTWNSKWIYKWRNNAFLEQEKWSHGISID